MTVSTKFDLDPFLPVDFNEPVWRYSQPWKLLRDLGHKTLHLTLLDVLRQKCDPYECSVPPSVHDDDLPLLIGSSMTTWEQEMIDGVSGEHHSVWSQEDGWTRVAHLRRGLLRIAHASCWRIGEEESEAMWKLYCGADEGIAVRSTFAKLRDSVTDPHTCVSLINYFHYKTGRMPRRKHNWDPALNKRSAFKHEQEVRVLRYDPVDWDRAVADRTFMAAANIELPWNMADIVDQIVVHPQSSTAYFETVRTAVARLAPTLADRVIRSEIVTEPILY
jgi:hypothetical protein